MVVAGIDTITSTIEFAMAELMNNPQVLTKVQQELNAILSKDNTVEEYHIHKLPYLNAVMKETLRLHPIIPLLLPRSPSKICTIAGYTIPKGAWVFFNLWAIQRDPSIWENPLEFRPERFLDTNLDFSGKDLNYFPFGSGRRICLGIAMAERMILYSLASLIHSFDWKMPQGEKIDLSEKFMFVLKKRKSLIVIPTPRLPNPALYE